jgi:hypothetical protein
MTIKSRCNPSELILDKYCSNDATVEETELVQRWIDSDCEAIQELSRRKKEMEAAFAPVQTLDALAGRVASRPATIHTGMRFRRFTTIQISISCLLLLVSTAIVWHAGNRHHSSWNVKGSDQTYCIIKRGVAVLPVNDSTGCLTGDTIQLYYSKSHNPFVMVLYAEGNQNFKPCLSADSAINIATSGQKVPLPFSIVIDSTEGLLEIAVVSSEKQFSQSQVKDWLSNTTNKKVTITRFKLFRKRL